MLEVMNLNEARDVQIDDNAADSYAYFKITERKIEGYDISNINVYTGVDQTIWPTYNIYTISKM